jgi:site-specific DNA-methyltransferase (adenine-specific)
MLELNRLYNRDCMAGMAEMPDGAFALAIVDPPYGINAARMNMGTHLTRKSDGYPGESVASRLRKGRLNSGAGKLRNRALNNLQCDWDFEPPKPEYFKELFRVSKNQIIWGGNYFNLPPARGIICWDKLQPWDNFSQVEIAWTSFDTPAKILRLSNTGGANKETKIHPTQKPVELYSFCLRHFSGPGDKVLDTHAGSASCLVAAHSFGLPFLGFEIDPEYCQKAQERLDQEMAKPRLFEAPPSEPEQRSLW